MCHVFIVQCSTTFNTQHFKPRPLHQRPLLYHPKTQSIFYTLSHLSPVKLLPQAGWKPRHGRCEHQLQNECLTLGWPPLNWFAMMSSNPACRVLTGPAPLAMLDDSPVLALGIVPPRTPTTAAVSQSTLDDWPACSPLVQHLCVRAYGHMGSFNKKR